MGPDCLTLKKRRMFHFQGGILLKRQNLIGCFACILGMTTLSHGQAVPTASRIASIQVGAGAFFTSPDYAQQYIKGLAIYGDYEFTQHIGLEAEVHYSILTPTDLSENTYLVGPRYTIRHNKFGVYAKALFGVGRFGKQGGAFEVTSTENYTTYAFGGGLEYKLNRSINIRPIDIELQKWSSFPPNGLSPISYSIGAAYVFH